MEKIIFQYNIVAHVRLSAQDIACLMECSQQHYDGVCKAAGQLGGKFFGWNNLLDSEPSVTVAINASDIGLMMKTLECPSSVYRGELWAQLLALRSEIEQDYLSVNT